MRAALLAALVSLAPAAAHAGFIFGGSIGSGYSLKPSIDRIPTTIMVAPGYGLGEVLRAEIGIVADMPDTGGDFNMQLRPMLVIDPPILPLHFRIIAGVSSLLEDPQFTWGGAVGVGGSVAGIGLFLEAGVLPRGAASTLILEGRGGLFLAFD